MPEDNPRVFDVSRPDRSAPTATSRPIIGGPPPSGDPMISTAAATVPAMPTQIQVTDDSSPDGQESDINEVNQQPDPFTPPQDPAGAPSFGESQQSQSFASPSQAATPELMDKIDSHPLFAGEGQGFSPTAAPAMPAIAPSHGKKRHLLAWLLVLALIVIIGGYLAIDSGLVKSSIKLPFHVFKQKEEPAASTPAPSASQNQQQTQTSAVSELQSYDDDFLSMKYPTAWTVIRDDNTSLPGTKSIKLYGPSDPDLSASTSVAKGHKASLALSIFKGNDPKSTYNVKIYDTSPLSITQFPDAKLLITSDTRQGGDPATAPMYLVISTDKNAAAGTMKISPDLAVNSGHFSILATVDDNNTPDMTITDLANFEKSQSIQDLATIISSIQFK